MPSTSSYPFDRLIGVVDRLSAPERVVGQTGCSRVRPERRRAAAFFAFARRLADAGLIALVEDPERLPELLARGADATPHVPPEDGALVDELRAYLRACRRRPRQFQGSAARVPQ